MTVKEIYGTDFPIILAPMAGITDLPFRILCKEQGADVMVTEMISAKALFYGNKNTLPLMQTEEEEKPIGVQIFGSEPELMGEMAHKIEDKGFSYIDINMGCPVPKIVNNKEGSALMLNPELAGRIVKEVSKAVSLPVTVKFRKGFDADHINAPEFAQIMEENGAAAVAVHGRTRVQYYTGQADWDIIRDVKNAVSIPVIGNGDIFKGEDAVKMRDYTGCDGIMVARGAKGNPWIFREVKAALSGKPIPERPTEEEGVLMNKNNTVRQAGGFIVQLMPFAEEEVISMLLRHAQLSVQYKGEKMGIREMRKHTAWYTTGMHGSSTLRNKVNQVETFDALQELLMR